MEDFDLAQKTELAQEASLYGMLAAERQQLTKREADMAPRAKAGDIPARARD
jgi:hypothetical protein